MALDSRHLERLKLIVRLAAHIDRRLGSLDEQCFSADEDEIDLTAFRLFVIGEEAKKLRDAIKDRHPEISWPAIYPMRNIIAHNYAGIVPARVWNVARNSLDALVAVCRVELERAST